MTIVWFLILGAALGFGVRLGLETARYRATTRAAPQGGWIYFLSAVDGAEDDPPSPIKIGMTRRDPATARLPEIEAMSPQSLEVIYSFYASDPIRVEYAIHKELWQYRHHGEWFDRDAVMMYLDHIKGAA